MKDYNSDMIKLIEKKRKEVYDNPQSVMKKFDDYFLSNGIYRGIDIQGFFNKILGRNDLSEGVVLILNDAVLINEIIFILDVLMKMGYDSDSLVEKIISTMYAHIDDGQIWELCELLYKARNKNYILEYRKLIETGKLGTSESKLALLIKQCEQSNA